jgi:hypothetical protein
MTYKIDPTILKELIELGDRLTEDRLREIVIAELEGNEMDGVAQAYALEEAEGDEKKARAYYTKHRVRRIRDQIAQESIRAAEARAEERAKQKQQAEEQKDKQRIEAKTGYSERENSDPFGSKGKTVLNVVINVTVVTVIIVVISMFIGMLTNL